MPEELVFFSGGGQLTPQKNLRLPRHSGVDLL